MLTEIPSLDSSSEVSELYTMQFCESCKTAIRKLHEAGYEFVIYDVTKIGTRRVFEVWKHRLGHNPNLVPQFWYKGQYIGGSPAIDKFLKENNAS